MAETYGAPYGSMAWLLIEREEIGDSLRIIPQPADSPEITAARLYLRHRQTRRRIEHEAGSLQALPYRLPELFRAMQLMRHFAIPPKPISAVDRYLPKIARLSISVAAAEPSAEPLH